MELLKVDCGNRVEWVLGPLNTHPPNPQAWLWAGPGVKATSLSHPPSLSPGSVVGCSNERWLVANCDLCGGGFGYVGHGLVEGRRWIQGVTKGDNLITAFYLLSSSSSTLAGSLALLPTSCRYGYLVGSQLARMVTWWSGQRWTQTEVVSVESYTHWKETPI